MFLCQSLNKLKSDWNVLSSFIGGHLNKLNTRMSQKFCNILITCGTIWQFWDVFATVIVLWSTAPSPFTQQMFLVVSVMLWLRSNSDNISSSSRQHCMFICVAFKSYMEWSNPQYVSTATTMILTTTAGTFHGLNRFSDTTHCKQAYTKILQNFWFT